MNTKTFNKYYKKYYVEDRVIQRIARKLAKDDRAMYEELVQTGLITLWKLDPKNSNINESAWIRQAIKFRMIDFVRKERGKTSVLDSLDASLARGGQLEKDPDTGHFKLLGSTAYQTMRPKDLLREPDIDSTDQDQTLFEFFLQEVYDDQPDSTS